MKNWLSRMGFYFGLFSVLANLQYLHAGFQEEERVQILTEGLQLNGSGLEIAPFYRPTVRKPAYNISYTDYTTAEELIKKHRHLSIAQQIAEETVEVDFIWYPEKDLFQCASGATFDYVIASHVIEHVPNVIGWLSQILSVLNVGGVLSLAVPNKHYTFDAYRRETSVHEMIDTWLRSQSIPSPAQIYDMLSNSADVPPGSMPFKEGIPFEALSRNYTDQQALEFAFSSFKTGQYLDIHCSVFTPESLQNCLLKIRDLGILNIAISEPISRGSEFFIKIQKLGEPRIKHPGRHAKSRW